MSLNDLGREILDFAKYASLTPDEVATRSRIVERMRSVVSSTLGPFADVTVFGSFSFSLSLCKSDVDIAVDADHLLLPDAEVLQKIADGIDPDEYTVEPILSASVPILKLTHRESGVHVDLSVATESTRPSVAAQAAFLAECPLAEPLIVITKALLRQWGLHSLSNGGLSSTSVYHLVERFFVATAAARNRRASPASPLATRSMFPSLPSADGTDDRAPATPPPTSLTGSRSSSPANVSDAEWRTGTQDSTEATQSASCTPPPALHAVPSEGEQHIAAARAFMDFLAYCTSDAYAFGFGLYDRLDPTNEVSRGTTRTLEIQALMKHTTSVLYMVLQSPRGSAMPPSPLSSVVADIRAVPRTTESPQVSVRVGDRVVS